MMEIVIISDIFIYIYHICPFNLIHQDHFGITTPSDVFDPKKRPATGDLQEGLQLQDTWMPGKFIRSKTRSLGRPIGVVSLLMFFGSKSHPPTKTYKAGVGTSRHDHGNGVRQLPGGAEIDSHSWGWLGVFFEVGEDGETHETETFLQEKVLLPFKNWFVSKTWFFTEPWLGWHIKNTHKDTHKPFIWWTCCIVSGKLATYLGELVVLQLPLLPSEPTSYQTPCRASYWKIPGFAFWKWSQTIPKWFTNWKTKWSHYLWSSYPAMHLPLKNLQCQSYSKMSADASQPNTNKLGFHKGFCHNTWPNRARSSLCWASRHVWREHMVQGSLRWLPPQVGSQDPAEMVSCIFNTKRNEVYCNHFGKRHRIVCRCCSF